TRLGLASNSITIIGLLTALLFGGRYVSLLGYLMVGVGIATMLPRLYDSAARSGSRRGAGLGALTAGMRIGSLIVPAAVGRLAESGLGVGGAVAVVSLPAAVGFVMVSRILRDDS
ncbi:MAG: MFS transporter, partial [Actinobacteria bacterium]|nr:MFS transporter [Actinomycetota bacterium]